jgi:hypothetical protein
MGVDRERSRIREEGPGRETGRPDGAGAGGTQGSIAGRRGPAARTQRTTCSRPISPHRSRSRGRGQDLPVVPGREADCLLPAILAADDPQRCMSPSRSPAVAARASLQLRDDVKGLAGGHGLTGKKPGLRGCFCADQWVIALQMRPQWVDKGNDLREGSGAP